MTQFQVGDLVRLRTGTKRLTVTRVEPNKVYAFYRFGGNYIHRAPSAFVHFPNNGYLRPGEKVRVRGYPDPLTVVRLFEASPSNPACAQLKHRESGRYIRRALRDIEVWDETLDDPCTAVPPTPVERVQLDFTFLIHYVGTKLGQVLLPELSPEVLESALAGKLEALVMPKERFATLVLSLHKSGLVLPRESRPRAWPDSGNITFIGEATCL